jgi:hypothetical protein
VICANAVPEADDLALAIGQSQQMTPDPGLQISSERLLFRRGRTRLEKSAQRRSHFLDELHDGTPGNPKTGL